MAEKLNVQTRLVAAVLTMAMMAAFATTTFGAAPPPIDFKTVLKDPARVHKQIESDRKKQESAAARADDPRGQVALANWWLAVPTARPATRWLLGFDTPGDRKVLAEAGEKASAILAKAGEAVEAGKEAASKSDEAKSERADLLQSIDNLTAFAGVFKLAEQDPATESGHAAWRKAALKLAIARESSDAKLAAAAQLWQAFALDKAGRRGRALEVLPDALAAPKNLPYDFMSRLLRCRLVAEAGSQPAAVAMLGQMEPPLKDWAGNPDHNKARRLVDLLQYRIVQQWQKRLKTATQPEAAAALEPLLKRTEKSFAEVKTPNLYYMSTAVPLLVKTHEAAPTTASASQP